MTPTTRPEAGSRADLRRAFVRASSDWAEAALLPASSDAGSRSYWRLASQPTSIVMDAPPADNDLRAWLTMHALLATGGVRVPEVLAHDFEQGFALLEDLGAATLLDCVRADNANRWFDAAITQLLRLQAIAPPPDLPAYDTPLLQRELGLFADWFVGRELGLVLDSAERAGWQSVCHFLVEQAVAQAQVLVHRDFMPRNLMPVDDELAVIDFQDAVRGPIAYDPLCLFRDAFVSWPDAQVDAWLKSYHTRAGKAGLPVPAWTSFCRDVELIGVQRHLKVLGIFARLKHRDAKPKYLRDAARFMAYLEAVLPRHPQLQPLRLLLRDRVRPALAAQPADQA